MICRGEHEQALGETGESIELVDQDVHVARRVRVALLADGEAHELGVTARDRDRRPELVRRVADEVPLAFEEHSL